MFGLGLGLSLGVTTRIAGAALAPAPANTVLPVVSGTLNAGDTLSTTDGTWNNSPTGFTYQWNQALLDGGGAVLVDGNGRPLGVPIVGATSSTYVLQVGDAGQYIFCDVTASNAAGSTTVSSDATGPVVAGAITTWNPADKNAGVTLSASNLAANGDDSGNNPVRATQSKSSGLYVYEVTITGQDNSVQVGLAKSTASLSTYIGGDADGWGYHNGGNIFNNNATVTTVASYSAGDVIGISFNAGVIKFWKNGVNVNTQTIGAGSWFPAASLASTVDKVTANFGATAFANTYTGFSSWNSA